MSSTAENKITTKPIKDYTIGEVIDICISHNLCEVCELSDKDGCLFNRDDETPEVWKLPPVENNSHRWYDCSKTLGYVHEFKRRCSLMKCDECVAPFNGIRPCAIHGITQHTVSMMQKWSDENPETPELTSVEVGFLGALNDVDYMYLGREHAYDLFLYNNDEKIMYLNNETFRFIAPGEKISIHDLKEVANGKKEKEAGTP